MITEEMRFVNSCHFIESFLIQSPFKIKESFLEDLGKAVCRHLTGK